MMKVSTLLLTFLLVLPHFLLAQQSAGLKLDLVPYPQQLSFEKGFFAPQPSLVIEYKTGDERVHQLATTTGRDLEELGFSIASRRDGNAPENSRIKLAIVKDPELGKEGYRIEVAREISLTANTADGLFWGTRTLLQLLESGPGENIPKLTITDHPEFEYRGLMIDNARHFHSIDFHIETVKRIAAYKLNKYHIHFSDDQSYTLPSEAFPSLPTENRYHTKEEIRQLLEVARRYHVAIIPEVDVPGHATALILGIDELRCSGRDGDRKLCIGKEETYETLEKLFSEVMELIPGEYWHLGADEVSYAGSDCPDCAQRISAEGLEDGTALYHYFINRMHDFVKGKDRKMLVWEGFSPMGEPRIDKDVIVCPFDIKHKGKMPSDYFDAGYNVLNTAWSPLYVADNIYMTTPEVLARWTPYMFGAGRSPQPFVYWKKFKPEQLRGRIIGAQMCSWDNEEKAEEGILFGTGPGFYEYGRPAPRIQIMAERLWSGSSSDSKDLLERVGASYWE